MNKYDIVTFKDNEFTLEVRADKAQETVWLTQKEMAELFNVTTDNVGLHIKNIYRERELETSTSEESSVTQIEGARRVERPVKLYNLDAIISTALALLSVFN